MGITNCRIIAVQKAASARRGRLRKRIMGGAPLPMFTCSDGERYSSDELKIHMQIGNRLHLMDLMRETGKQHG